MIKSTVEDMKKIERGFPRLMRDAENVWLMLTECTGIVVAGDSIGSTLTEHAKLQDFYGTVTLENV